MKIDTYLNWVNFPLREIDEKEIQIQIQIQLVECKAFIYVLLRLGYRNDLKNILGKFGYSKLYQAKDSLSDLIAIKAAIIEFAKTKNLHTL